MCEKTTVDLLNRLWHSFHVKQFVNEFAMFSIDNCVVLESWHVVLQYFTPWFVLIFSSGNNFWCNIKVWTFFNWVTDSTVLQFLISWHVVRENCAWPKLIYWRKPITKFTSETSNNLKISSIHSNSVRIRRDLHLVDSDSFYF